MPPILEPYLYHLVAAAVGLCLGAVFTWLLASGRQAALAERIKAEERRGNDIAARLAHSETETQRAEQDGLTFRSQLADLRARLELEIRAAAEKQALLDRAEAKLTDTFKALSADALRSSNEQFLQLARSSLGAQAEEARKEIENRKAAIEMLIRPVAESLGKFEMRVGELEKAREGAYAELKEQVRALGESQLGLQRETASLVRALRQPTGRGQWGEMQLRRVVELAGMQEHCDFETQHQTLNEDGKRLRPDLLVRLPGGKTIVVDSKAPMEGHLDALEATDDVAREAALQRHAKQVRRHIEQLASKNYAAQFHQAPEFTVLFLPSESFLSAALHSDPGLLEVGVNRGVILATPTTLIALLRAVAYGWRQEALAENAREISALGRTLHERLGRLGDHFARLGRSLGSAVEHYNSAIGAFESRVLTSARRFEDLKAATVALPILQPVDKSPRIPQDIPATLPTRVDAAHEGAPAAWLPPIFQDAAENETPIDSLADDVEGANPWLESSESTEQTFERAASDPVAVAAAEVNAEIGDLPVPAISAAAELDEDFALVPDPPASARNAAADLRSALE
jgi:DNA recombination protein RmuC